MTLVSCISTSDGCAHVFLMPSFSSRIFRTSLEMIPADRATSITTDSCISANPSLSATGLGGCGKSHRATLTASNLFWYRAQGERHFVRRRREMRGDDRRQGHMWSYLSPEARVPKDHPLRPMRAMVDRALGELDPLFRKLYSKIGRPSIAPEMLLRALVLQILYSVRSERLLMEHLDADLRFRWFVGLSADDPVWDVTVFTKNRARLLKGDVAAAFFAAVIAQAQAADLLSDEHFSVDGTLIEAWAGQKSFRPKDQRPGSHGGAGGEAEFKGKRRTNDTHESKTDAQAR